MPWLLQIALMAAPLPPAFMELESPGPPPYAWGAYWLCSMAAAEPSCWKIEQHQSGGAFHAEKWSVPRPPEAGRLTQLQGSYHNEYNALDAQGRLWADVGESWALVPETRGTKKLAGDNTLLCGITERGAWCADGSAQTARVMLPLRDVVELVVNDDTAGFVQKDGKVAVLHTRSSSARRLQDGIVWLPALRGSRSLAVLHGGFACGITPQGTLVCASVSAPARPLTYGSDEVGASNLKAVGDRLVALQATGVLLMALADDGRVLATRPPEPQGDVYAADGVGLVGGNCIVRKSGPWWCVW